MRQLRPSIVSAKNLKMEHYKQKHRLGIGSLHWPEYCHWLRQSMVRRTTCSGGDGSERMQRLVADEIAVIAIVTNCVTVNARPLRPIAIQFVNNAPDVHELWDDTIRSQLCRSKIVATRSAKSWARQRHTDANSCILYAVHIRSPCGMRQLLSSRQTKQIG